MSFVFALTGIACEICVWPNSAGVSCYAQEPGASGANDNRSAGKANASSQNSGDSDSAKNATFSQVLASPPELFQQDATLPDAIYLRDEKNRTIFVPKLKYEDFEAFLRERSGAKISHLPVGMLEGLTIQGKVTDGTAELKLHFTMSVTDASAKIVQVPLGLQRLNWTKPAVGQGGRRNIVIAKNESEGVVWVVEPDGSDKYFLDMEAVLRVDTNFSESSLRLSLPECSTLIKIDLPRDDIDVEWSGSSGEVLEKEKESGNTRAIVHGRGAGKLVWRDRANVGGLHSFELDSYTRLAIMADDSAIRASTRLRFSSSDRSGPREFTIRLPAQATWVTGTSLASSENWSLRRIESHDKTLGLPGKKPEVESVNQTGEVLKLQFANTGIGFNEDVELEWLV